MNVWDRVAIRCNVMVEGIIVVPGMSIPLSFYGTMCKALEEDATKL